VDVVGGIGFPLPGVFAFCSALAESVAALLLSAGLFTRWAAVALAANMVVAIYFHAAKGERSELAMFYLVAALVLALTGPGRWALDSRRK
jgi:putative oxidoreductase